jgi:hypothetical protein
MNPHGVSSSKNASIYRNCFGCRGIHHDAFASVTGNQNVAVGFGVYCPVVIVGLQRVHLGRGQNLRS